MSSLSTGWASALQRAGARGQCMALQTSRKSWHFVQAPARKSSGTLHVSRKTSCCKRHKGACAFQVVAALDTPALMSWLTTTGSVDKNVPVEISTEGGQACLIASRPVKAGETLLEIPEKAWITPSTVSSSRIGPLVQDLEPWVQLVLFLMLQDSSSSSAAPDCAPYVASLPVGNPGSTLFWEDDELASLEGSQCLANTMGYREFLEGKFCELEEGLFAPNRETFPPQAYSREAFFRAFGWLRARVHPPLERENIALVPLADLAHHSSSSKATWTLQKSKLFGFGGKSVVLEAGKSFQQGEKITMNFAPDGLASQLAVDYGVADESLAGFSLTLSIPEDDRFFEDKADIAEISGLGVSWTWTIRPQEKVPEDLMAFLRLVNCSGEDAFHLEALFRDAAWDHFMEPISPANEGSVCKSIVDGCTAALSAYGSSIDEDLALLRSASLSDRQSTAVQIRLGEKQTLDSYLLYFAGRLDRLNDIEYYAEKRLKSLGLLDDSGKPPSFEGMLDSGIA